MSKKSFGMRYSRPYSSDDGFRRGSRRENSWSRSRGARRSDDDDGDRSSGFESYHSRWARHTDIRRDSYDNRSSRCSSRYARSSRDRYPRSSKRRGSQSSGAQSRNSSRSSSRGYRSGKGWKRHYRDSGDDRRRAGYRDSSSRGRSRTRDWSYGSLKYKDQSDDRDNARDRSSKVNDRYRYRSRESIHERKQVTNRTSSSPIHNSDAKGDNHKVENNQAPEGRNIEGVAHNGYDDARSQLSHESDAGGYSSGTIPPDNPIQGYSPIFNCPPSVMNGGAPCFDPSSVTLPGFPPQSTLAMPVSYSYPRPMLHSAAHTAPMGPVGFSSTLGSQMPPQYNGGGDVMVTATSAPLVQYNVAAPPLPNVFPRGGSSLHDGSNTGGVPIPPIPPTPPVTAPATPGPPSDYSPSEIMTPPKQVPPTNIPSNNSTTGFCAQRSVDSNTTLLHSTPPPSQCTPQSDSERHSIGPNEPSHPAWKQLDSLLKHRRCLQCRQRHWQNSQVPVCVSCLPSVPRMNCIHCRVEFLQHDILIKAEEHFARIVCLQCARSIARLGEPKSCSICHLEAAFGEGLICARCEHFRKLYGEPVACSHCTKIAAFQREPEKLSKVDGLHLCFECTITYKKEKYKSKKRALLQQNSAKSEGGTAVANPSVSPTTSKGADGLAANKLNFPSDAMKDVEARWRKQVDALKAQVVLLEEKVSKKEAEILAFAQKIEKENYLMKREVEEYKRRAGRDEVQINHLSAELTQAEQKRDLEVTRIIKANQEERDSLHDLISELKQKNEVFAEELEKKEAAAEAVKEAAREEQGQFAKYKLVTERRIIRIAQKFAKAIAKRDERAAQRSNKVAELRRQVMTLQEERDRLAKIERLTLGLEESAPLVLNCTSFSDLMADESFQHAVGSAAEQ